MADECVFCKIIKGEIPSKNVYEDDETLGFLNINPVSETHILIVPKKHISSFMEIENGFDLSGMVKAAQKIIKDKKIEKGYRLIFNGGKYQAVPHLHLHLLAGNLEKHKL